MSYFSDESEIEFAKEDLGKGDYTLELDKSKDSLSESSWGDVDKISLRNKILSAKNYKSIVDDVYMMVLDGWEESPSSNLKYPVMQVSNGKLVYNRYGLSSALGYAEKNGEDAVVSKIRSIYSKLDLDEGGKEEMSTMQNEEFEKPVEEEVKKEESFEEEEGEEKEPENEVTPSEEESEKEEMSEEVKEPEVKMGLDAYLDMVKILELLEDVTGEEGVEATEEEITLCKMAADEVKKTEGEKDFGVVAKGMFAKMMKMSKVISKMSENSKVYLSENEELKKFKSAIEQQRFLYEVEQTLKEVENAMPFEEIDKSREDSKTFSLDNIDVWKNAVKAKAFTFSSKNKKVEKKEEFQRWAILSDTKQSKGDNLWTINK
jgi:hypothetical protein